MKLIVALAALLAAAPSPYPGNFKHDEAAIVLLSCERMGGRVTGTAFKVTDTLYITARHVLRESLRCTVGGAPVLITYEDDKADYATFIGPESPATLKASCDGFQAGHTYAARGYPGGAFPIFTPWVAAPWMIEGNNAFLGESIPGMSGGPVLDGKGRVVGVAIKRWPAQAISLSNTGYCKA